MANGEQNGNGWRGWALTLAGGALLSMLGLWNTTLERRVTRSEDRETALAVTVEVGLAVVNAKLDAWLENRGIDPMPIEREAVREVTGK